MNTIYTGQRLSVGCTSTSPPPSSGSAPQRCLISFYLILTLAGILGRSLRVPFSQVKYSDIAHVVGLCPGMRFRDAPTFEIDRARIPTSMFKQIIWDMQVALNQYGPPIEHQNEETRSRVLSTVQVPLKFIYKHGIKLTTLSL